MATPLIKNVEHSNNPSLNILERPYVMLMFPWVQALNIFFIAKYQFAIDRLEKRKYSGPSFVLPISWLAQG